MGEKGEGDEGEGRGGRLARARESTCVVQEGRRGYEGEPASTQARSSLGSSQPHRTANVKYERISRRPSALSSR